MEFLCRNCGLLRRSKSTLGATIGGKLIQTGTKVQILHNIRKNPEFCYGPGFF